MKKQFKNNKFKTANFPAVEASRKIVGKQAAYYNSTMKNLSDEEELEFKDKHLGYSERTQVSTQIKVYIDEAIEGPKYYRGVVDKIASLGEGDQVIYFMSSPGGRMDGMISLIEANRMTDADILCVIVGECHSAASFIALSCPNISVSPSANMLVHFITFGAAGPAANVKANVEHTLEFAEKYFRDTYEGFLTEEEMDLCINLDKQMWMQSDEIIQRLENRQKYFEALDAKNASCIDPFNSISDLEFPTLDNQEIKENIPEVPKKKTKSKPKI